MPRAFSSGAWRQQQRQGAGEGRERGGPVGSGFRANGRLKRGGLRAGCACCRTRAPDPGPASKRGPPQKLAGRHGAASAQPPPTQPAAGFGPACGRPRRRSSSCQCTTLPSVCPAICLPVFLMRPHPSPAPCRSGQREPQRLTHPPPKAPAGFVRAAGLSARLASKAREWRPCRGVCLPPGRKRLRVLRRPAGAAAAPSQASPRRDLAAVGHTTRQAQRALSGFSRA